MICDPNVESASDSSVIISQIGKQISCACGEQVDFSMDLNEVARAIEHFLEKDRNSEFIDSKTLALLAAQAMSSIGESDVARRLVVFGTGMVGPSQWIVTGDHAMWVLDLREMTIREDAPLELLFFKGMQIVIESMADVWDESRGDGVLGLRHICCAASKLLCASEDASSVTELTTEIKGMCTSKLNQLRDLRGWLTTPMVLNLDL